jgi:hypothetical protein
VQVPVELGVAPALARAVERDDRGVSGARVAPGQRDPVVLDPQLFQRSSFGNGSECTSISVLVGRVSAT